MIDMTRFRVHPRAAAPQLSCKGFRLTDVYASYSYAKACAFHRCECMCRDCDGSNFRIVSHNSFSFAVAFEFVNPENGRAMVAHITSRYNHAYYIDEVN